MIVFFLVAIVASRGFAQDDSRVNNLQNNKNAIDQRIKVTRELFCSNNKCHPAYESLAFDGFQYQKGFNEGLNLVLTMDRNDGTDLKLREKLKSVRESNRDYLSGFFAALEVHSAVSQMLRKQGR